jgi:hypothetical protein
MKDLLKYDKHNGYFSTLRGGLRTFMKTSRCNVLRMRNVSDKIVEEFRTHI